MKSIYHKGKNPGRPRGSKDKRPRQKKGMAEIKEKPLGVELLVSGAALLVTFGVISLVLKDNNVQVSKVTGTITVLNAFVSFLPIIAMFIVFAIITAIIVLFIFPRKIM